MPLNQATYLYSLFQTTVYTFSSPNNSLAYRRSVYSFKFSNTCWIYTLSNPSSNAPKAEVCANATVHLFVISHFFPPKISIFQEKQIVGSFILQMTEEDKNMRQAKNAWINKENWAGRNIIWTLQVVLVYVCRPKRDGALFTTKLQCLKWQEEKEKGYI